MEVTRTARGSGEPPRHFREQGDEPARADVEIVRPRELPLEINATDEPGGDPYNHTGRFRRNYR